MMRKMRCPIFIDALNAKKLDIEIWKINLSFLTTSIKTLHKGVMTSHEILMNNITQKFHFLSILINFLWAN